jgi:hypothetical protein
MSKKMRMMILFGILFGMVTICVNPVLGFDPNGFKDWTVTAYGSDDLLGVRAGLRPWAGRAELGLFGMWMDGLSEGDVKSDTESNQQESWGLDRKLNLWIIVKHESDAVIRFQLTSM